jgi:hypothetical protein
VLVPIPNAFTINKVGLHRHPFPFACRLSAMANDVTTLNLCACRLRDMADLLAIALSPTVVGLDASHYVERPGAGHVPADFAELATGLGINATSYDVGWAALGNPSKGDRDLLVFHADQIGLLAEEYLFDLQLVRVSTAPPAAFIDDLVLALRSADAEQRPLLDGLPSDIGPRVSTHDDCYVYVESRDAQFPRALVARTLTMFAGTLIGVGRGVVDGSVEIGELPIAIVDSLLGDGSEWSSAQSAVSVVEEVIHVPLAKTSWRLSDPLPTGRDRALLYDLSSGEWAVE